jgi:RES domain-containing protein
MRLHRISLRAHASTAAQAFSGQGGVSGLGRWHTRGQLIVYLSERLSLSMAESLVHIKRSDPLEPFVRWEIEVPDDLIAPVPVLPKGWERDQRITRAIGDRWLMSRASVAMRVPSALVPMEFNCLLNPAHPQFELGWAAGGPLPFVFDPRLLAS